MQSRLRDLGDFRLQAVEYDEWAGKLIYISIIVPWGQQTKTIHITFYTKTNEENATISLLGRRLKPNDTFSMRKLPQRAVDFIQVKLVPYTDWLKQCKAKDVGKIHRVPAHDHLSYFE